MKYTDSEIVSALKGRASERERMFRYLYLEWSQKDKIMAFLQSKGLDRVESDDVFKDGLIALDQAVQKDRYDPERRPVQAYLFGICRYLWIERLKKKKEESLELKDIDSRDAGFIVQLFDQERAELIDRLLSSLTERCRRILKLWSLNYSMKEIARNMNYASETVARKSKHQCLKALDKYLESNMDLKNRLKKWL